MLLAAIIAFSINYLLYRLWIIDSSQWFVLAFKTITIFISSMTIYIIISALLKIEFVGELLERIRNYIRQKTVR